MSILDDNPDEVLASIEPGGPRRAFATGVLGILGGLLIYIAATHPPADLGWLAFLIAMGLGLFYLSWRLWEATGITLELTRTELREQGGRILFSVEEVNSVDRGFFAFKPATGFLVRLNAATQRGRVYAPGLWWRAGKTVMVGGATARGQAKSVADLLTIMVAEKKGDLPKR